MTSAWTKPLHDATLPTGLEGMSPAGACRTMAEVRAEIDRLDRELVALLAARAGYVKQAAHIKGRRADIVDPERIEDVIAKVRGRAQDLGLSPELVEAVYRLMIQRFIELETPEFERLNDASQS